MQTLLPPAVDESATPPFKHTNGVYIQVQYTNTLAEEGLLGKETHLPS